jgi:D-alanyl-D-alanine carboxypeptidase-like protein
MHKLIASTGMVFVLLVVAYSTAVASDQGSVNPASSELCDEMVRHKTQIEGKPVSCRRLALVKFSYFGFDRQIHHDGEIVVLDAVADHVLKIFDTLRDRQFPLEKARLLNLYDGDDDASMADNNTSSFNDRLVSGSNSLSMHAYGLAIDLNPVQNPFIQKTGTKAEVSPKGGEKYLDRTKLKPGMAEPVIDVFADNGFSIWGGDWHNPIDYQHFQVGRDLVEQLIRVSSGEAKVIFDKQVEKYRQCRQGGRSRKLCMTGERS